jgi:uncharacterized membrane protein (UPF0136 family)
LRITIAGGLVLITTVCNFVRLWTAIAWAGALGHYLTAASPLYIAISGGAFALLGTGILWGCWRRRKWAPRLLLVGAWGYTIWEWADRLFVQSQQSTGRAFAAVASAVLLAFVTAVALDPRNRFYFQKRGS